MIARDLHFNTIQMGYIFSAFGIAYAAMEIPSGWLIDRFGPRPVLTSVVLCWPLFTAATGLAWNFYVDADRAAALRGRRGRLLPRTRQDIQQLAPYGRARPCRGLEGVQCAMGSGRCAPLLVVVRSTHRWAGRVTFVLFGAVGLVWAGFFLFPGPQSSGPRRRYRRRPAAMGNFLSIAQRLGSLHPVVLSLLRFLLLRSGCPNTAHCRRARWRWGTARS